MKKYLLSPPLFAVEEVGNINIKGFCHKKQNR
jgi:hypothetical protein